MSGKDKDKVKDPAAQGGDNKDSKFKLTDWMPFIFAGGAGVIGTLFGLSNPKGTLFGSLFQGIVVAAVAAIAYNFVPEKYKSKITDFFGGMMGDPKVIKAQIDTPEKVQALLKGAGVEQEIAKEITGTTAQWKETLQALETVPGYEGGKLLTEMTKGLTLSNITSKSGIADSVRNALAKPKVMNHVMNSITDINRRKELFSGVLKLSGVDKNIINKITQSDPKVLLEAIESVNGTSPGTINIEALLQGKYDQFFTANSIEAMLTNPELRGMVNNLIDVVDMKMEVNGARGRKEPADLTMDKAVAKAVTDLIAADDGKRFKTLYENTQIKPIIMKALNEIVSPKVKDTDAAPTLAEIVQKHPQSMAVIIKTLDAADMKQVLQSAGFKDAALDSASRAVTWLKAGNSKVNTDTNLTTAMAMLKEMGADGADPVAIFQKHRTNFSWTEGTAGEKTPKEGAVDALKLLVVNDSMFKKMLTGVKVEALRTALTQNKDALLDQLDFNKLALELGRQSTPTDPVTLQSAVLKAVPELLKAEIVTGDLIKNVMAKQDDLVQVLGMAGVQGDQATKIAGFIHSNQSRFETILGKNGLDKLAHLMVADPNIATHLQNPASLFSDPAKLEPAISHAAQTQLVELQKIILDRAKNGVANDKLAVEKALAGLEGMDKLGLTPLQLKRFDLFKLFVVKGADVAKVTENKGPDMVSNLDHLATQELSTIYALVAAVTQQKIDPMEADKRATVIAASKGLDLDFAEFVKTFKEMSALTDNVVDDINADKYVENIAREDKKVSAFRELAKSTPAANDEAGKSKKARATERLGDIKFYEWDMDKDFAKHLISSIPTKPSPAKEIE